MGPLGEISGHSALRVFLKEALSIDSSRAGLNLGITGRGNIPHAGITRLLETLVQGLRRPPTELWKRNRARATETLGTSNINANRKEEKMSGDAGAVHGVDPNEQFKIDLGTFLSKYPGLAGVTPYDKAIARRIQVVLIDRYPVEDASDPTDPRTVLCAKYCWNGRTWVCCT
jgi:hypothetical protein